MWPDWLVVIVVSVCLPPDALSQCLPSYLGFSCLGCGVSLHGCFSKAQPLLLILDRLSVEFSRPEYWSGYPFPYPGDLPNPRIESRAPALQVDSLPAEPHWKPYLNIWTYISVNTRLGFLSTLTSGMLPFQQSTERTQRLAFLNVAQAPGSINVQCEIKRFSILGKQ